MVDSTSLQAPDLPDTMSPGWSEDRGPLDSVPRYGVYALRHGVAIVNGLSIGELARRAGVGVETIRFYERRGLLDEPRRTASGYRDYEPGFVDRVRFIRKAKTLGFELREIGELLALACDQGSTCADVRRQAEAKVADAEARIGELQRIRRALLDLAADCHGDLPASSCPFLDRLDGLEEL